MPAKTLYDKLWDAHVVRTDESGTALLYIDRHLLHEVTTPQPFEGLKLAGRKLWRVDANLAVSDHNVPTTDRSGPIQDPVAKLQVDTLDANCDQYGITQFKMNDPRQGIVHVIGPEQGATLPGMTLVCGDSHTSTHGALACLAMGIGTSEVEHVLATQCLTQAKMKNMKVVFTGTLGPGVTAKDMALALIGKFGTAAGTGHAIEYCGDAVSALSMEGRMTLCNMTIEFGARNGMIAVDDVTIDYVKGRPFAPTGELWEQAVAAWRDLKSDEGAHFDKVLEIDASEIVPQVTWGTSPELVAPVDGVVPDPAAEPDEVRRRFLENALRYMALEPGMPVTDIAIDKVFIGSCTNGRIEDLRGEGALRHHAAPREAGRHREACDGGSGLRPGEVAGRGRGARSDLPGCGLRMARARVLHVSGHERRSPGARRALCRHLQPQLRGASGRRWTHASGKPRHGGGSRDRGTLRRRPGSGLSPAPASRSGRPGPRPSRVGHVRVL